MLPVARFVDDGDATTVRCPTVFPGMARLQQGNRLFAQRQYEAALDAFLLHARECPAEASDAYAKAAKSCQHINRLSTPKEVEPGVQLVFEGNRKAAKSFFEKALSLNPRHYESLIGIAALLSKNSDERLEIMERAMQIQPHYLTLVEIGDFYRSVRSDLDNAYSAYKAAVERSARDRTAYQRLAATCVMLGRVEEAKEWKLKWKDVYGKKRKVGPVTGERRNK